VFKSDVSLTHGEIVVKLFYYRHEILQEAIPKTMYDCERFILHDTKVYCNLVDAVEY